MSEAYNTQQQSLPNSVLHDDTIDSVKHAEIRIQALVIKSALATEKIINLEKWCDNLSNELLTLPSTIAPEMREYYEDILRQGRQAIGQLFQIDSRTMHSDWRPKLAGITTSINQAIKQKDYEALSGACDYLAHEMSYFPENTSENVCKYYDTILFAGRNAIRDQDDTVVLMEEDEDTVVVTEKEVTVATSEPVPSSSETPLEAELQSA